MERVVKGLTGYSKEKENKPATHIILTVSEYDNLLNQIKQAEIKTEQIKQQAKKEVNQYIKQANYAIEKIQKETQEEIKTINDSLEASKIEIKRLNDLNSNLLRIMKEKANSERNRKPKKQRNGYLVLNSIQYTYNFYFENGRKKYSVSLPCWKTYIQSFYDCSIPFTTVEKEIKKDLTNSFGKKLNIDAIYDLKNVSEKELYKHWNTEENFVFKTNYKQNIKSGYWEIEYLTSKSIQIPEDMR